MINLDTDDEEDAPRWAAPQPPARATLAAAEAREEAAREEAARAARCEADEERTAPRQMRVSTLPAPPVGWRLADQELRLMADGATTADKCLTKVLVQMRSGDAAPQDDEFGDTAGQHGGVWQLAVKGGMGTQICINLVHRLSRGKTSKSPPSCSDEPRAGPLHARRRHNCEPRPDLEAEVGQVILLPYAIARAPYVQHITDGRCATCHRSSTMALQSPPMLTTPRL